MTNANDTYGTPCEKCGSLVNRNALSAEVNGKVYHGRCYGSMLEEQGTPFQCGVCQTMGATVPMKNEHVSGLKVWVGVECLEKYGLASIHIARSIVGRAN